MVNIILKYLNLLKNKKKEQSTGCFCPNCNNELINSGSFVKEEKLVHYKCVECKCESEWLFDAPAPILISK